MSTTLISDTFTDSNVWLKDHTISPTNTPATSWTDLENGPKIQVNGDTNNRADNTDTGNPSSCWLDAGVADCTISVTARVKAGDSPSIQILFRATDSNNFWLWDFNDSGTHTLYEKTAGSYTDRGNASLAVSDDTNYALQVVLSGNSITCTIDGGHTVSYSSSVRNTATKHGLRFANTAKGQADNYLITVPDAAPALVPGTASFVSSGPASIVLTSTDADDGTPPYTYQWERSEDGVDYDELVNDGSGVSGVTTLNLVDGSAEPGILYRYRLRFSDNESPAQEEYSNVVTAQLYEGGAIEGGGGGSVFDGSVFA